MDVLRDVELLVLPESWPIAGNFTISRGTKTSAEVVVVELRSAGRVGRGECVPYPRYGESVDGVADVLRRLAPRLREGLTRRELLDLLPAGAARNAIDCALWDLEAKVIGRPAWELAQLPEPKPLQTAVTIGLGSPAEMAAKAREYAGRPLLKVKVGADDVVARVAAVREAAPAARMIVDANEAWTLDLLRDLLPRLKALHVGLIEQPLPAGRDAGLAEIDTPEVPLCADESVHASADLDSLVGRYQAVNIKLDKTGGLTEALALRQKAEDLGFAIMTGCMVGTSLAMAPAMLVAQGAEWVDLDGPLMLARDRPDGLTYDGGTVYPPASRLWG